MLVINNTKKTIHISDWSEKEKSPPLDIAVVSIVVSRPAIEPTNINMSKKINDLAIHEKDTGSSEVQIAIPTKKIENLSKHFKNFKKDKHSNVGLLRAVNKRKKLLDYLKRNNAESYKNLLSKLNLRK